MPAKTHPGFRILTLLGIVLAAPASQEATAQSAQGLARCAAIENADDRLACYDAALGEPPSESPPNAVQSESVTREEAATTPATEADTEPQQSRSERRRAERERNTRRVTIVSAEENFTGFTVFTAADGEIFRETSVSRTRYPELPFEATVEPGSFGSHFLLPDGESLRIRVSVED